jgi:hypothetical protein
MIERKKLSVIFLRSSQRGVVKTLVNYLRGLPLPLLIVFTSEPVDSSLWSTAVCSGEYGGYIQRSDDNNDGS